MKLEKEHRPAETPDRLSPAAAAILCVWIVALTVVFLLLNAPPGWLGAAERAWPRVADLKSTVQSFFHRESRF